MTVKREKKGKRESILSRDSIRFVFVFFFRIRIFVSINEAITNTKRILYLRTYHVVGVRSLYVYMYVLRTTVEDITINVGKSQNYVSVQVVKLVFLCPGDSQN